MSDSWIANLSDGSTKVEEWRVGELSPWQRLMEYCKVKNAHVTALRLTVGVETVACPSNASGYWQAHGMPSVQGVECDEELHKWRGIGYVEGDVVHIIWGARDPMTHDVVFWQDSRSAKNQAQIVWTKPQLITQIAHGDANVRNLEAYQDKMVESIGGLRDQYVPEH